MRNWEQRVAGGSVKGRRQHAGVYNVGGEGTEDERGNSDAGRSALIKSGTRLQ